MFLSAIDQAGNYNERDNFGSVQISGPDGALEHNYSPQDCHNRPDRS